MIMIVNNIKSANGVCLLCYGGDEKMAVDPRLAARFGLSEGVNFDITALRELNDDFEQMYATDAAFTYLTGSARTEKQLKDKLFSLGISAKAVMTAVNKMKGYGYINDRAYAESFVNSAALSLKGPGYIKNKLREKGVGAEDTGAALATYSLGARRENAEKAAAGKNRSLGKYPPVIRREKISRALASLGYSAEDIREAVEAALSVPGENADSGYEAFYVPKIERKIASMIRKGTDKNTISRKIAAEFTFKGAERETVEKCLQKYFGDDGE